MALDAKNTDPVLRYCAVGRQLGYGVYLSLDAVTFVSSFSLWGYLGAFLWVTRRGFADMGCWDGFSWMRLVLE